MLRQFADDGRLFCRPLAWLWAYSKPVLYKMAYGTDKHESHVPEAQSAAPKEPPPDDIDALRAQIARLEAAKYAPKVATASPFAMVNDYMGYLTTAKEYATQNYEGAMNLYGRRTLKVLIAAAEPDSLLTAASHAAAMSPHARQPTGL